MLSFIEDISLKTTNRYNTFQDYLKSEAEFKEFEPWLKFKLLLKLGWFYSKLY